MGKQVRILLLHGPNLNLLGTREPGIYGSDTLDDLVTYTERSLLSLSPESKFSHTQSNHEGVLIDTIHAAPSKGITHIIINAGAWTHTSVAIRDALLGVGIPYIEVHLSNVYKREEFRGKSFLADRAVGVVCGLGREGYRAAVGWCVADGDQNRSEEKAKL